MSHELTVRENGFVELAYMGDHPWHRMGQQVPARTPIHVWREKAGLDWEVSSSRVCYRSRSDSQIRVLDSDVVLHRSDNGNMLGIVSSKYEIVQPAECLDFFRDLIETAGLQIDCVASLFGGKRYFVSAKIGEDSVLPDDSMRGYLLLTTSADGTLRTTGKFTAVRTVCNNTLTMALAGSSTGGSVSVSHRTAFDAAKAKQALGLAPASFSSFMDRMRKLSAVRLSGDMAETLTAKLVGKDEKANSTIAKLFLGDGKGATLQGVKGTAWGWLNAVTEYEDHHTRAKSDSHRLNNSLFGKADDLKTRASGMALEYAGIA